MLRFCIYIVLVALAAGSAGCTKVMHGSRVSSSMSESQYRSMRGYMLQLNDRSGGESERKEQSERFRAAMDADMELGRLERDRKFDGYSDDKFRKSREESDNLYNELSAEQRKILDENREKARIQDYSANWYGYGLYDYWDPYDWYNPWYDPWYNPWGDPRREYDRHDRYRYDHYRPSPHPGPSEPRNPHGRGPDRR